MNCLIRQPAGLGDILFCLKVAKHFKDLGYNVVWPVISEFSWVGEYIEGIEFPQVSDNFIGKDVYNSSAPILTNDFIFIPLQDADRYYPASLIMDSKYQLVGLSHDHWQESLIIKRNEKKERDLFNLLNPTNEPYIFTNKNYGSPPSFRTIEHIPFFNIKTIEMSFINGFSLFDWLQIMELAKEIHLVDTCLSYVIEATPSISCPLYLYSRYEPKHFNQTRHLYSKSWNYVL